jgi:hypothetical protein
MTRPLEIDRVPVELRQAAELDLDNGASPTAVWENQNLGQHVCLRTWQAHATQRSRGRRIERISEQGAYYRQIVKTLGIDTEGLSDLEKLKLGAACRGMLAGGTATAMLRAVEVANDIRRTQIADSAQQIAQAKFAAWKTEWEQKERDRLDAANRRAETIGRDEGLSADAIEKIKQIYGLPTGGAGHAA